MDLILLLFAKNPGKHDYGSRFPGFTDIQIYPEQTAIFLNEFVCADAHMASKYDLDRT